MMKQYISKLSTLVLDNIKFKYEDWIILIKNIVYFKELKKISLSNFMIL
jgi:hypothetical protein